MQVLAVTCPWVRPSKSDFPTEQPRRPGLCPVTASATSAGKRAGVANAGRTSVAHHVENQRSRYGVEARFGPRYRSRRASRRQEVFNPMPARSSLPRPLCGPQSCAIITEGLEVLCTRDRRDHYGSRFMESASPRLRRGPNVPGGIRESHGGIPLPQKLAMVLPSREFDPVECRLEGLPDCAHGHRACGRLGPARWVRFLLKLQFDHFVNSGSGLSSFLNKPSHAVISLDQMMSEPRPSASDSSAFRSDGSKRVEVAPISGDMFRERGRSAMARRLNPGPKNRRICPQRPCRSEHLSWF